MRNCTIKKLAIALVAISPCLAAQATETQNPQVSALIKKGIAQAKQQEFHQAIASFNEALAIDPNSADSFINRGWTFRQMGDFDHAVSDYTSALKIQPKKAQVYLNRGWCEKRLNKLNDALQDFNKAIELDPKYLNAYRNRGSLKLKMGDYSGAISDFNQLMVLDPDAKSEVAKYVPPELLEGPKKIDPKTASKVTTQIAAAVQGSSFEISDSELAKLNNRAARAIKTGDFGTAIGILEDITKKKPNYSFARENLTTAYNNQGLKLAGESPEKSAAEFRKALFYSPQQGAARTNLNAMLKTAGRDPNSDTDRIAIGDELSKQGDYKGAFVEYMEALKLNNGTQARQKVAEVCALIDASKKQEALPAVAAVASNTPSVTGTARAFDSAKQAAEETPAKSEEYVRVNTADNDAAAEPASTAKAAPKEPVQEAEATALSLNPIAKEKIGHDKDTYKLKWQNHIVKGDELYDQGDYAGAEAEYKESISTAKKLGGNSSELIDSLERLSRIFLVQRRPVEGLSLLEQAYALRKESPVAQDTAGLERLGQKVLKLRQMLYPHEVAEEKTEEAEEDEKIASEDEEKMEVDELDKSEKRTASKPPRRPSRFSPLINRMVFGTNKQDNKSMNEFETADRPSAGAGRASFDDWNR